MLRKASFAAILAGAVGVPYAMWNGNDAMQSAGDWFSSTEAATDGQNSESPDARPAAYNAAHPNVATSGAQAFSGPFANGEYYDPTAHGPENSTPVMAMDSSGQWILTEPNGANSAPTLTGPSTTGPTALALGEFLRLDVSKSYVTGRFTRVTTALADGHYDGLRVPLVTGTHPTALTGSLTYYFDRQEQLQRITFHGTTGDPRELTAFLIQQWQFERRESLGGELYTKGWMNRTSSVCRIRPASVLHAGATNSRYEVLLEINRSQWKTSLSDTAKQLLE